MIPLDRVKACSNPKCRQVLPADRDDPSCAGFYVDRRRPDGSVQAFKARCKRCCRMARVKPIEARNHRVHVEVVDGTERHVKFCPGCSQTRVAEDGAPDSGFYVSRRGDGYVSFYRLCRRCLSEARKDARRTDPRFRQMEYEARQRWMAKPENRERYRETSNAWQRRYRATHRDEVRERDRMAYRLRAERRGIKPSNWPKVIDGTRPEVPAAPFVEWLSAYKRARDLGSASDAALELGLGDRRTRSLLSGAQASVSVDVVSRALTEARVVVSVGCRAVVTFDDLYPGVPLKERVRTPHGR